MRFIRIIIVVFGVAVPGCTFLGPLSPLRPLEQRLVFQPARYPAGDWEPAVVVPEDIRFTASDGTELHGWYVPHPEPNGVALFCHGNAGNVSGLADTLAILNRRHGLSVMAFDYRGYGHSEGRPTEQGVYLDARAARAWLARREGIPESEIILMGQSLGGAVAVELASHDGARALVLASTFTSLPDVAAKLMPGLPARWLMTYRFDSLRKIQEYRGPLLISHGTADEVVAYELGQALFDAAGSQEKRFVEIPGGRHNDPLPEDYRQQCDAFLQSLSAVRVTSTPLPLNERADDSSGVLQDSVVDCTDRD